MLEIRAKSLALFAVLVVVITSLTGIVVTIWNDQAYLEEHGFYVSTVLDYDPVEGYCAFGFGMVLVAWSLLLLVRYFLLKEQLLALPEGFSYVLLHGKGTVSGLIALIAGHGVLCFGVLDYKMQHLLFAGMFISCCMLQIMIDTYVQFKVKSLCSRRIIKLQLVTTVLAFLNGLYFLFVAIFVLEFVMPPGTETPDDLRRMLRLSAAGSEYFQFILFFLWHGSYWNLYSTATLRITSIQAPSSKGVGDSVPESEFEIENPAM